MVLVSIHPFGGGNGRIGRLLVNMILLKNGYPVLVLSSSLSNMFNHAVEMSHQGDFTAFARLLGQAIFRSLQVYEDALGL